MFILKLHECLKINIIKTQRIKINYKPKAVLKSVSHTGLCLEVQPQAEVSRLWCFDSEKQWKAKQHYLVRAKFQMQPISILTAQQYHTFTHIKNI